MIGDTDGEHDVVLMLLLCRYTAYRCLRDDQP